ncbi:DUF1622 domain-containing protein [Gloeocapsa sp. PCC 73106]|uniref:DUF1622 domain-containing protein n=1 Tax=Gloeocapsa sp. PCC 73106 TaxID=102232 RepID=UPI0002ACF96D|nr:DUF1622 domain-containing protein [Gloeocapsa sp. PCC 73106]ELR98308.1 putative membrane protein [Gloeocapsa sp. PCC 73106]
MEHLFENLELALLAIVRLSKFLLETISVFCVLGGLFKTGKLALAFQRRSQGEIPLTQLRISFGLWLALALEFQLGADILATTLAPTTDSLIQLAVIAVIRTFLNYFLNQELEKQLELTKNR